MPLFTLPLAPSHLAKPSPLVPHPQNIPVRSPSKKRKRTSEKGSPSPSRFQGSHGRGSQAQGSQAQSSQAHADFPSSPPLAAASTNPLSLAPDEIRQYRLAGLEIDERLPAERVEGWPHRGLKGEVEWEGSGSGSGSGSESERGETDHGRESRRAGGRQRSTEVEEEEEVEKKEVRGRKESHLRVRHLGVLTAVMQRCLLEGDIVRAKRAWGLLLRAQVGGKSVDVRGTGYWGVGAEVLIREGERRARGRKPLADVDVGDDAELDHEQEEHDEDGSDKEDKDDKDAETDGLENLRWGTPHGIAMAKEYYERLILQYPFKRQYSHAITAVDFWPAMLACEIYGIQAAHKSSIAKLLSDAHSSSRSSSQSSSPSLPSDEEDDDPELTQEEQYFASQQRRDERREKREAEKLWEKKEVVRMHTLEAAEAVALRMDELMTSPPFSDSRVLWRLRGMVALWVGDLGVPGELGGEKEEWDEDGHRRGLKREGMVDALRELGERAWTVERALGEERREENIEVARRAFEKVARRGGVV